MTIQDVNVVILDFKTSKVNEMVTANEDGSYTVFINARLSYEGRLKAYEHAMYHIENEDFGKKCSADLIECYAHTIT